MANSKTTSLFEPLRQAADLIVKGLRPHIEQLTKGVMDVVKPFAETVRRAIEEHELNIKTGWWYPNYIVDDLPDDVVHEALLNESKTKAFTKLVLRECKRNDYVQLRAMHDRWQSYEFLKAGRKRILADVIAAHLNKQYTLSIPVAMAQVDYFHHAMFPKEKELHVDYTSRESVAASQRLNFAKHFHKENPGRVSANVYFQLYPVYHYFKNVLYANERLRKFQKEHDPDMYKLSDQNNRGAILHGEKANYMSEARSLKQILLIDKILHNINKIHKSGTL